MAMLLVNAVFQSELLLIKNKFTAKTMLCYAMLVTASICPNGMYLFGRLRRNCFEYRSFETSLGNISKPKITTKKTIPKKSY